MSSNDCPSASALIDAAAGLLDADRREALDAHIDGCAECYELVAEIAGARILDREAPASVGRYEIRERLGAGSMGAVYVAHDPVLDRDVAIKLLDPLGERGRERFLREARGLARLEHPNVTAVHDAGAVGEHLYIAMELVTGTTLRRWLERERSWHEIVEVFRAAGRGLEAAHRAGLVHRDFKPDNVLIDETGRPVVTDLGLVGFASDGDPVAGGLIGSPAYMAPEAPSVDHRGDQFSFAASLYEALYRRLPFAGDDVASLRDNVVAGRVRPPEPGVAPRRIAAAIARGLSVDPADRFASMAEMIAALAPPRRSTPVLIAAAAALAATVAIVSLRSDLAPLPVDPGCAAPSPLAHLAGADPALARAARGYRAAIGASRRRLCAREDATRAMHQCLDDRRDALAGVLGALDGADPIAVRHLTKLIAELPAPGPCERLPGDLAAARPIDAPRMWRQLMLGHLLRYRGDLFDARAVSKSIAGEAIESGYAPIASEALLLSAKIEYALEGRDRARESFRAAAEKAEIGHADQTRAEALLGLLAMAADEPRTADDDIDDLAALARAAIERSDAGHLERSLEWALGLADMTRHRYPAALEHLERALALARAQLSPDDPFLAQYRWSVDVALVRLGRLEEARAGDAETLRLLSRSFDPDHPRVSLLRLNLATKSMQLTDCERALPLARRSLAELEPSFGPRHPNPLLARRVIASCLARTGDLDGALAELSRERSLHRDPLGAAECDLELGRLHELRDDPGRAIRSYERTIAGIEGALSSRDVRLVLPLTALGQLLAKRERLEEAEVVLERALAIADEAGIDPANAAETRFSLAVVLGSRGRQRARARELAIAARDGWRAAGPDFATWIERVDDWLGK